MRFLFYFSILCLQSVLAQNISVLRNPERTSGAYWVEQNIPSTLSPYLWLDASNPDYFSSDNNLSTTFLCPQNNASFVRAWKDRSGNNRHFYSYGNNVNSARPKYYCNTLNFPFYKSNAHITGDGVNDELRFDFSNDPSGVINTDFTFVFVMNAEDPNPSTWDSFISSGTNPNVNHNWQISTTSNKNNFYFLLKGKPHTLIAPFDTQPHVFILQRKKIGNTIHVIFKFDGNQVFSYTTSSALAPTLSKLKLFRNRNENTYIEASFSEFFVFTQDLSANEEYELEQYLLSKWGI